MSDGHKQSAPLHNQRKLPSIPPMYRQPKLLLTYRGAVNWMENHREILDTALGLMEMHPKLIRTKVCDRLFTFVSNLAFPNGMETVDIYQDDDGGHINGMKIQKVPAIAVSKFPEKEDTRNQLGSVDKLYICGITTERKWTKLVLSLSQNYYIRCSPEQSQETKEFLAALLQSDAFVFLMDSQSICHAKCLEELETALAWNINIVFIRESNLRSPSSTPTSYWPKRRQNDKEWHHTKNGEGSSLNFFRERERKMGIRGENVFNENNVSIPAEGTCVDFLRPNSSVSVSSVRSAPELCNINNNDTKEHRPTETCRSYNSSTNLSSRVTSPSVSQKIDIMKVLHDGYNNALIYDTNRHQDISRSLLSTLNKRQRGFEMTNRRSFLSTPTPTENHNPEQPQFQNTNTTSPVPEKFETVKDNHTPDAVSDIDLSSQETVYLIYSNEGKAESPQIFRWPSDCVQETIPNSPSVDSFGFEDIDLSKNVNNFEFCESDSD